MWPDNETRIDLLGYSIHKDLIKDIVLDPIMLPTTIGIFGDWGSGKSSLLKMLKNDLELTEDTVIIYFNGWLFEGYDDSKAALIESIIKELEKDKKIKDKIGENIKKVYKSIDWMRLAGSGIKNIAVPIVSGYFTGGASLIPHFISKIQTYKDKPEEWASLLKEDKMDTLFSGLLKEKDQSENNNLIRDFRSNFEELIDKSELKRLIVIIDDLDRCSPERIIDNLEAIKLFLNVKKTAFIIGADPRIVSSAIHFRYKELYTAQSENEKEKIVNDYLEKLIQIPYNLPKLSDAEVETYISLLFCQKELYEDDFSFLLEKFEQFRERNRYSSFGFGNIKALDNINISDTLEGYLRNLSYISKIITEGLKGNPRQVKRYLNKYLLRKKLAKVAKIADLKDDVLAKLMILEYTEFDRYNDLNNWQSKQDGKPEEIKELEKICSDKDYEKENFDKYKEWNFTQLKSWIAAEPLLSDIDLRDYFWISRDKLSDIIKGSSLIPPYIKELFRKLNSAPSEKAIESIIDADVSRLQPDEINLLFNMMHKNLVKNPAKIDNYKMCSKLIKKHPDKTEEYINSLSSIKPNKLLASSVFDFMELSKDNPKILAFLKKNSKRDTNFGKAVKKQLEGE